MGSFQSGFCGDVLIWEANGIGGPNMMILFSLILLAALGLGIYLILKRKTGFSNETDSALDLLKKRFANGEIDEDEYRNKKRILEN